MIDFGAIGHVVAMVLGADPKSEMDLNSVHLSLAS
jgi:hypothetical protein